MPASGSDQKEASSSSLAPPTPWCASHCYPCTHQHKTKQDIGSTPRARSLSCYFWSARKPWPKAEDSEERRRANKTHTANTCFSPPYYRAIISPPPLIPLLSSHNEKQNRNTTPISLCCRSLLPFLYLLACRALSLLISLPVNPSFSFSLSPKPRVVAVVDPCLSLSCSLLRPLFSVCGFTFSFRWLIGFNCGLPPLSLNIIFILHSRHNG